MALFGKKGDLLKVIEFIPSEEQRKNWLMYLHPNAEFNSKSKLRVNPGQVAIAVHAGKIEHIFEEGSADLTTDNFPFLKGLMKAVYGGVVPYDMKIYFLNSTAANELLWGTPSPIPIVSTNPMDGKFRYTLTANGKYFLRLKHYQYFLENIAGGLSHGSIITWDEVASKMRPEINQAVKSELTAQILNNQWEFGQVVGLIIGAADKLKEVLKPKAEFFGFDLTEFVVNDVNIPEEDQKRFDELYKERQRYSTMGGLGQDALQAGLAAEQMKVMQTAAANEGNVGGMMGVGLGFGYGMSMMQQAENQPGAAAINNQTQGQAIKIRCPKCGSLNDEHAKFCQECGNNLQVKKTCPKCGKELEEGAKFCPECGEKVG